MLLLLGKLAYCNLEDDKDDYLEQHTFWVDFAQTKRVTLILTLQTDSL